MKLTRGAIFSIGEENTYRVLEEYFQNSPFLLYKEVALNRVIKASRQELNTQEWGYYTRASLDFVVCSTEPPHPWELAIEFDSAFHDTEEIQAKDELKNRICLAADLPLIRLRSDHVIKRENVSFLKYMLDLYFGEKVVQEQVERGALAPDEEFFPHTEFYGTTKLRKKLEDCGIVAPGFLCIVQIENPDEWLWYRVGSSEKARTTKKGQHVGAAKVEILQGWYQ